MGGANSIIAGWRAVFRKGSTALYSVSSHPLQEIESKQDLADLAPKGRLVAISAVKGAIVEVGKTQETARDLGLASLALLSARSRLARVT